ncbi:UDP-N-acetylmuramate--L-alanine ligase [Candidatus Jorgensenbacteria bacterium]|nr:UDP-N-acetylmuramate--L-alanine ligase [Candidatus Jorgensenbacteria bacterium]
MSKKYNKKIAHFIGIGGIGMSSLAQWFLAENWAISGSDMADSGFIRELRKLGLYVKIGHKKANIRPKTSLVVYNQAISDTNPEILEARRKGIQTLSYPEVLGGLTRRYRTVAIAGAHGKSTSTALAALVLIKVGFDPTVIIGTRLREFRSKIARGNNFRNGRSDWLIAEADEWKAAFLNYRPYAALITNVDREHLDYYKNFVNIKKTFLRFIMNIRRGGILVVNRDNPGLWSLRSSIALIAKKNNLRVFWYHAPTSYDERGVFMKIKKSLQIPGQHNFSNAVGVYNLCRMFGIQEKYILAAFRKYHGAWRRLEYRGKFKIRSVNGKYAIDVYDDYAHHPTEIKATLQGLRERYPFHKIICVFQPHQAERLRLLFKEFIRAFDEADNLILLPIYRVVGRDKMDHHFTSKRLSKDINKMNKKKNIDSITSYLPYPSRLPIFLRNLITKPMLGFENSVIVMMGAGDIVKLTDSLLE